VAYYRAVAPEYDEADQRDVTQIDRAELETALARFDPSGDVLEIAGGTGVWTIQLARYADHMTVVDACAENLARNGAKAEQSATPVEHVVTDIFDWRPHRRFDVVFFSFWLSHVPPGRFDRFWDIVGQSLLPGGRVFFIDNALPVLEASDHVVRDHPESGVSVRKLSDGRQFNIVKVYWQPDVLQQRLATVGFDVSVRTTAHRLCIYGSGTRQPH
jgi:demethylmenaquinone methyltransferase/2-methoxy-6-polyprenyl-1,4-benzoquinol methylase